MRRTLGDRRASARVEIVGNLWGTLDLIEPARVIDISPGGALLASSVALPQDSVLPVQVTIEGNNVVVDARVRHVRRSSAPDASPEYWIGVEFLAGLEAVKQ
jgi:hypothetical protein